MSLAIDTIFVRALSQDIDLMTMIADEYARPRLWGTAAPMPDVDFENVPAPYIIITFDSLTNDGQTKDNPYEGDTDQVNISIDVVAKTLNDLHSMTQRVRDIIFDYMMNNETDVLDYQFTASAIQYDGDKPAYWQVLSYQCDTNREETYGEDN